MYSKKFVFSAFTVPAMVYMNHAADFQKRRREDKEQEAARRSKTMTAEPVDITPKNGGHMPWCAQDAHKFEKEWSMKPVKLTGFLDFNRDVHVLKYKDGEKGVDVITPFYTHLDKNEKTCGILVNRGWIPWDLKHHKYDRAVETSTVQGVLYRGDAKTKYSKRNAPVHDDYKAAYPEELAILTQLGNRDEASSFMLKAVDFNTDARTPMPDVPSPEELGKFVIPAERHAAYESFWNGLTYVGVVANTAMWLYL